VGAEGARGVTLKQATYTLKTLSSSTFGTLCIL